MQAQVYLSRYAKLSSYAEKQSLLQEANEAENADRKLFAQDRDHASLDDLYKGLVPVFGGLADDFELVGDGADELQSNFLRSSCKSFPEEEALPRLFKMEEKLKDEKSAAPLTVGTLGDFRKQFMQTFSCNALQYLDWNNVVAAGGSVVGCLE